MIVLAALSQAPPTGTPSSRKSRTSAGALTSQDGLSGLCKLEERLRRSVVTADSETAARYSLSSAASGSLSQQRAVWETVADAIGRLFKGSRPWQNPA
jgi:hypothetical protein